MIKSTYDVLCHIQQPKQQTTKIKHQINDITDAILCTTLIRNYMLLYVKDNDFRTALRADVRNLDKKIMENVRREIQK